MNLNIDFQYLNTVKNVAIFGSSGAIGNAFVNHCLTLSSIEKLYCFSRSTQSFSNSKITHLTFDYEDESTLIAAQESIDPAITFDLIIIATGALHVGEIMPEKSIRSYNASNAHLFYLLNTIGPGLVYKHFWQRLSKQNKSIIATLCARIGSIEDNKLGGWYSYRASKAATAMMVKSMSIELSRRNQHAICVALHPGTVESNLSDPFHKNINPASIITPDVSVNFLMQTLENLQSDDSGFQFAYDGKRIPC